MKYNTRIAPSPTGDMHIGTARTAYFNWLAARSTGGDFILRIDDTDKARSKDEYVEVIKDTLVWLGLDWDDLIFQSERVNFYKNRISGGVFKRVYVEEGAVKLSMKDRPIGLPATWHDEVVGNVAITDNDLNDMDGMVLMKSDGTPTYNWATVVDDLEMKINFIIRGTDHITNTSKQVVLWSMLGWPLPKFAHVGLIGVKGKPLSKREGAASMLHYRTAGYDPDAILNFLARIGWGPKVDDKTTKMLPREKMLELFLTGGTMRSAMSNLDMDKLEAFDRKYKAQKGVWRNKERLDETL